MHLYFIVIIIEHFFIIKSIRNTNLNKQERNVKIILGRYCLKYYEPRALWVKQY